MCKTFQRILIDSSTIYLSNECTPFLKIIVLEKTAFTFYLKGYEENSIWNRKIGSTATNTDPEVYMPGSGLKQGRLKPDSHGKLMHTAINVHSLVHV